MNERTEQRTRPPLIHGRMIYRCEQCGKSWPMYLEKGIEEFGENHKPSPFTIACPYCGGWAMDVSGIQEVPGGGYVPLPDECCYFANTENKDYGVPTFPAPKAEKAEKVDGKTVEILIADEIDGLLREMEIELAMVSIAGYTMTAAEAQKIMETARILALQKGYSLEGIIGAMMNALNGDIHPKRMRRGLDFTTAWDRKEAREKRQAVERETASRFLQYKVRELSWKQRQGKRPHWREWRGPDRT